MEVLVFALGAALTCAPPDSAARGPLSRAPASPPPVRADTLSTEDVFSLRARRRAAAYLRMRLLELRKARLDRAAEVIERRLGPDALLHLP